MPKWKKTTWEPFEETIRRGRNGSIKVYLVSMIVMTTVLRRQNMESSASLYYL